MRLGLKVGVEVGSSVCRSTFTVWVVHLMYATITVESLLEEKGLGVADSRLTLRVSNDNFVRIIDWIFFFFLRWMLNFNIKLDFKI